MLGIRGAKATRDCRAESAVCGSAVSPQGTQVSTDQHTCRRQLSELGKASPKRPQDYIGPGGACVPQTQERNSRNSGASVAILINQTLGDDKYVYYLVSMIAS